MAIPNRRYEPQTLAAGDTISFQKSLGLYRATDGWGLTYEAAGPAARYPFNSVASGADHLVIVTAAVTSQWVPGDYELVGYAVNAGTGERQQIYQAPLTVTPNLQTAPAGVPVKSFAQQMVEKLQLVLLGEADHDVMMSIIEGTKIERYPREKIVEMYNKFFMQWQNEIDGQRARQGLPSRNKIKPIMRVTPIGVGPGAYFGQWPY